MCLHIFFLCQAFLNMLARHDVRPELRYYHMDIHVDSMVYDSNDPSLKLDYAM